jgi:hypothetical protein
MFAQQERPGKFLAYVDLNRVYNKSGAGVGNDALQAGSSL